MPELPEVETTKTSLTPLLGKTVHKVQVYQPKLRWQMPDDLASLQGYRLDKVARHAKYLLLTFCKGTDGKDNDCKELIIHLGMSGSLQQHKHNHNDNHSYNTGYEKQKHDHLIMEFVDDLQQNKQQDKRQDNQQDNQQHNQQMISLHYHDPRRFGAVLWKEDDNHYGDRLLNHLGVEPLTDEFSADYLYQYIHTAQKKPISKAIKSVIMEQKVVVGVGNIYATESLFMSNIHPATPANLVSKQQIATLVKHIKSILEIAIEKGGSSLKDFSTGDGQTGYFQQTLLAYGNDGKPCPNCATTLQTQKINGRASVFCEKCQDTL